jgi:hypothetical protein
MSELHTDFSTSLGDLAKALAAAQSKITGASRDRKNPHTGSMYADLASVWAACREPLSQNELAVVQTTEPHGMEGVCVVTTLIHSSGQWMRGKLFVPCVAQVRKDGRTVPVDAQTFGSALTYARRYSLAALVGVAPEDDDGEAAVKHSREAAPTPAKAPPVTGGPDVSSLEKEIAASNNAEELAAVSAKVGAIVGKIDPKDRDRLRAARDNRVRELAQAS